MPNSSRRYHHFLINAASMALLLAPLPSQAQTSSPEPLDPTNFAPLTTLAHIPLAEQYIWTAGDVTTQRPDRSKYSWSRTDLRLAPHDFRAHFTLASVPQAATLYIAGPREATVYLNGQRLGQWRTDPDQPINFRVFHVDAGSALRAGENVLAIRAVRGRGVVTNTSDPALQQLAYGEILAAKLLPSPFGDDTAAPLLISNTSWRSLIAEGANHDWSSPTLNDSAWPTVAALGTIDSNIDFLQWSADAGMYGWPGYTGMSQPLRNYALPAAAVLHVFPGSGAFGNLDSLKQLNAARPFIVTQTQPTATDVQSPSLLLDFGREVTGRLLVESNSATGSTLSIAYGESELEAVATGDTPMPRGGNYLGTNLLEVPAHGIARGPKSAFRYVRIRFLRTAPQASFPSIRLEGIAYPVPQRATFISSDATLNRIYETAAYTAHLCMQDGIWDAPKRDRGRWSGDLDIEAPVIYSAFGDSVAAENTLARLAADTPPGHHVNGIPSYTATWLTAAARLYQLSGNRAWAAEHHGDILGMLARLDADLDSSTGLLKASQKGWGFVDWSPGFYANSENVTIGTTLHYLRAYQASPELLRAAGDEANARRYAQAAEHLATAARQAFLPATGPLGPTWQLNALAVLTRLQPSNDSAIWNDVFSRVQQKTPTDPVISPYFNAYLIDAMSRTGHPREALDWIRAYWGGMLAEGATSFWESYDLRWPKTDFHLSLQADGTSGYFVSLAHGWSSGPALWIAENILGVRPLTPGYASVSIQPQLLGLEFAKGTVPTPHGMISVSLDAQSLTLHLPSGVESADMDLPGPPTTGQSSHVHLTHSGDYTFRFTSSR